MVCHTAAAVPKWPPHASEYEQIQRRNLHGRLPPRTSRRRVSRLRRRRNCTASMRDLDKCLANAADPNAIVAAILPILIVLMR